MRAFSGILALASALVAPHALAAPTAIFPTVFVNSSPLPTSPEETARVAHMTEGLKTALASPVSTSPSISRRSRRPSPMCATSTIAMVALTIWQKNSARNSPWSPGRKR